MMADKTKDPAWQYRLSHRLIEGHLATLKDRMGGQYSDAWEDINFYEEIKSILGAAVSRRKAIDRGDFDHTKLSGKPIPKAILDE